MRLIEVVLLLSCLVAVCISADDRCVCNSPTLNLSSYPFGADTDRITAEIEKMSSELLDEIKQLRTDCLAGEGTGPRPRDCDDIKPLESGIYTIYPGRGYVGFPVYCNMTTTDGGWIVIQRRVDGIVDFYRTWDQYKTGFGHLDHEFWLGNDKIHSLVSSGEYKLRVDMVLETGEVKYAEYDVFSVGGPDQKYALTVSGYQGTAGDWLTYHSGKKFTTKDQDNDIRSDYNCAVAYTGGWWYGACHHSNLNGKYGELSNSGVIWNSSNKDSLRWVEMKVKRNALTLS